MGKDGGKSALSGNSKTTRHCPFLKKPFADCFCLDMDSQKTFGVLDYCQANFENCEIYQRIIPENKSFSNE
jgi:hypothetical protein